MFELHWTINAKSLKTISDYRNMFLAATFSSIQLGGKRQIVILIYNWKYPTSIFVHGKAVIDKKNLVF